jgi:hypothetical protein
LNKRFERIGSEGSTLESLFDFFTFPFEDAPLKSIPSSEVSRTLLTLTVGFYLRQGAACGDDTLEPCEDHPGRTDPRDVWHRSLLPLALS